LVSEDHTNGQLVAKRFFHLEGEECDEDVLPETPIKDITEHREHIINEAERLSSSTVYLKEFFQYCASPTGGHAHVSIDKSKPFSIQRSI